MAGEDNSTYGFNKQDARALVESIGNGAGKFRQGSPRRGGGSGAAKIALATSGVTARSGTTVGSGTVTEYKLSGTTLTTNTTTFTAYNLDAKAIPSNQYVLCVQESITSQWIVQHPGIIDLRLSGNDLQYTFDGTTWTTWTTATTCA